MAINTSEIFTSKGLWLFLVISAFAATAVVYSEVGFIQSFLPFFLGIFALRQYFRLTVQDEENETNDGQHILQKYDINPDQEYSSGEQIEILTTVRSEYSKKRVLWAVLGVLSLLVGGLFIAVSVILTFISVLITGYCLIRLYHTYHVVSLIDDRVRQLEDA
jgi:energy-coupling factor transporter transmembrane protein EcfT